MNKTMLDRRGSEPQSPMDRKPAPDKIFSAPAMFSGLTSHAGRRIDELVYELYGLSEEELCIERRNH